MYAQHFGLKHEPFSIAPDPHYLFMSERHREALAHLLYGVNGGGGFVLLTGEIGAGKTTVCRCFLEQIPKRCNVAYIFNPKLTVVELLRSVCEEFHIPFEHEGPGVPTVKDYVDPLNAFLLRTHGVGQNNVLIIDEAQNLSPDVLEQLRLLTNLETSERKLLQIILIGQPELRAMLARPELEQLAQRVIARFHLDTLTEDETRQYMAHRLSVAGARKNPFDTAAARRVHRWSRGVPRRINLLCDRALLGAYARGRAKVDLDIVDRAAREVFDTELPGKPPGGSDSLGGFADAGTRRRVAWGGALVLSAALCGAGAWRMWTSTSALDGSIVASSTAAAPASAAPAAGTSARVPGTRSPLAATPSTAIGGDSRAPALKMTTQPAPMASGPTLLRATALPAGAPLPWSSNATEAWQQLAALWGERVAGGPDGGCPAVAGSRLLCHQGNGGLAEMRLLDRPGLLTLRDAEGRTQYAVVAGLGPRTALLRTGNRLRTVRLEALAGAWRGRFATFWRPPPGYQKRIADGDGGPVVDWLAASLARARQLPLPQGPQRFDADLKAQLQAFQLAQGLKPDGIAGAVSLMRLNQAIGVDEPRLQTVE